MSAIEKKQLFPWDNKEDELDNALKRKKMEEFMPQPSTVSIAIPGSILMNAKPAVITAYVAGQLARAACTFRVDEVIVYQDVCKEFSSGDSAKVRGYCMHLDRLLKFLGCPQYLQKFIFPVQHDLRHVSLLNPLNLPHNLRRVSQFPYREGIVSAKKGKNDSSLVYVGYVNDVEVHETLEPGTRVTVKMPEYDYNGKRTPAKTVPPNEPRRITGVYWGYNVRVATSLADIFQNSTFGDDYDLTIGISYNGKKIDEVPKKSYNYHHLLIVFGGREGLEAALLNDEHSTVKDPTQAFHHYLNALPNQGGRIIRVEKTVCLTLDAIQEKLNPKVPDYVPATRNSSQQQGDANNKPAATTVANAGDANANDANAGAATSSMSVDESTLK